MSTDSEDKNVHKNVNIYLANPKDRENVLAEAGSYQKYIILMNESLQSENRQQTIQIAQQAERIEGLEDDEDRADKRLNNVKGLLKNFNEMHKWEKEVAQTTASMLDDTRTSVNGFKHRARRHLYYLQGALLCFMALHVEVFGAMESVSVGSILAVVVAFQISTLGNLVLPSFPTKEKRVRELLNELKTTLAAQDYIHEFIDHQ